MPDYLLSSERPTSRDPDRFSFAGERLEPGDVIRLLAPFVSPERQARIADVVGGRTYTVAPVVEGLINMGNVSAVMRSAEALGYQSLHVIAGDAVFKNSPRTAQGADKWLDVQVWNTPAEFARVLRAEGYRIVATHLDETAVPLDEVDFTRRTALVFGNEADGVSSELLALSDQRCIIPMSGFVQSFNISVAAAVSLYHAALDRTRRLGRHGDLSTEEAERLVADFYLRSVKNADRILADALTRRRNDPA